MPKSPTLAQIIAQAQALIDNFKPAPYVYRTPQEALEDMGFDEEGDIDSKQEEAGDWFASFDDSWEKTAYGIDVKRTGDRIEITYNSVDVDGNWEYVASWDSETGTEEEWREFHRAYLSDDVREHAKGWAEYHIWCAENGGKDPLQDCLRKATPKQHAQHALDYAQGLLPYPNEQQQAA